MRYGFIKDLFIRLSKYGWSLYFTYVLLTEYIYFLLSSRLNKQKLEKLRQDYGGENSETYKGFHPMYWAFSKAPLVQTLTKISSPEVEQQALQISMAILTYAGLSPNGNLFLLLLWYIYL